MKVAMFGLGYVETVTAACRAGPGHAHRAGGGRHVARHDVPPRRCGPGRRMTEPLGVVSIGGKAVEPHNGGF